MQQWTPPPCPYPTTLAPREPYNPPRQPGILGARPQQAYNANMVPSTGYTPTDIEAAIHTLTLSPPDENWYMDTGATSHMTSNSGTLAPYFNLSSDNKILVGNGNAIPIHGHGNMSLTPPCPPLSLNNVLHAPKLIKN